MTESFTAHTARLLAVLTAWIARPLAVRGRGLDFTGYGAEQTRLDSGCVKGALDDSVAMRTACQVIDRMFTLHGTRIHHDVFVSACVGELLDEIAYAGKTPEDSVRFFFLAVVNLLLSSECRTESRTAEGHKEYIQFLTKVNACIPSFVIEGTCGSMKSSPYVEGIIKKKGSGAPADGGSAHAAAPAAAPAAPPAAAPAAAPAASDDGTNIMEAFEIFSSGKNISEAVKQLFTKWLVRAAPGSVLNTRKEKTAWKRDFDGSEYVVDALQSALNFWKDAPEKALVILRVMVATLDDQAPFHVAQDDRHVAAAAAQAAPAAAQAEGRCEAAALWEAVPAGSFGGGAANPLYGSSHLSDGTSQAMSLAAGSAGSRAHALAPPAVFRFAPAPPPAPAPAPSAVVRFGAAPAPAPADDAIAQAQALANYNNELGTPQAIVEQ